MLFRFNFHELNIFAFLKQPRYWKPSKANFIDINSIIRTNKNQLRDTEFLTRKYRRKK